MQSRSTMPAPAPKTIHQPDRPRSSMKSPKNRQLGRTAMGFMIKLPGNVFDKSTLSVHDLSSQLSSAFNIATLRFNSARYDRDARYNQVLPSSTSACEGRAIYPNAIASAAREFFKCHVAGPPPRPALPSRRFPGGSPPHVSLSFAVAAGLAATLRRLRRLFLCLMNPSPF